MPKLKKRISEETKKTKEAETPGLTSHYCLSTTTSFEESKVANDSDNVVPIIELLGSSDDEAVTEPLNKSVTSPTVKTKIKLSNQNKRKKTSPSLACPGNTSRLDDPKKPRMDPNFKIPKEKNLTKEHRERNRDMPIYAREQGEKEIDEEFQKMFEGIWNKACLVSKPRDQKPRKGEIDDAELKEMKDNGWNEIKNLESDEERLRFAKEQFKNSVKSDPGRNLAFHGFKMKKAKQQQDLTVENIMEQKKTQFIINGSLLPLSQKSKVEAETKKSKISEVEARMKKRIIRIFFASGKSLKKVADQVGLYLAHFRSGLEEQTEFLKFYSDNEVFTDHTTVILPFFNHLYLL